MLLDARKNILKNLNKLALILLYPTSAKEMFPLHNFLDEPNILRASLHKPTIDYHIRIMHARSFLCVVIFELLCVVIFELLVCGY